MQKDQLLREQRYLRRRLDQLEVQYGGSGHKRRSLSECSSSTSLSTNSCTSETDEVDIMGYNSNQSDTDDHSSIQSLNSDGGVAISTKRLTLLEAGSIQWSTMWTLSYHCLSLSLSRTLNCRPGQSVKSSKCNKNVMGLCVKFRRLAAREFSTSFIVLPVFASPSPSPTFFKTKIFLPRCFSNVSLPPHRKKKEKEKVQIFLCVHVNKTIEHHCTYCNQTQNRLVNIYKYICHFFFQNQLF